MRSAPVQTDSRGMPVRVLAVLPYPLRRAGSQRYRIEQWMPLLSEHGVEVTTHAFFSAATFDVLYRRGHVLRKLQGTTAGYLRRARLWPPRRDCDVMFVHREAFPLGPGGLERAYLRRRPYVYDFDDAIFVSSTSAGNRWAALFKKPGKTAVLCRHAAQVTAGNEYLADYARRYSAHVTVVPTTIDTELYVPCSRATNPVPVLGWTGSVTTAPYLSSLHGPLLELQRRHRFDLRVIGAELALPGLPVTCLPWHAETEVADVRSIDIGLMPMPDDPWTRGKCGFKALQYMALGIPPVVSPVGANAEIVTDGENGLHARSPSEWVDTIGALLASRERRTVLGAAARRTVEQRYSARVHAPRVAALLRDIARRHDGAVSCEQRRGGM